MRLANVEQLAEALNVSPRRVQQLATAGMPRAARGRYDTDACLRWFVRFLQDALQRRESLIEKSSSDAVRRARARLLQTETERREIDLALRRGQLIPLSVFEETMGGMIRTARQRLLQLPGRIAPQLEGEPRALIKHKLTLAVHDALSALSRGDPEDPHGDNPNGHGSGGNGHAPGEMNPPNSNGGAL